MAAIDPPAPQSFDSALVKRGRDLAAIGNCNDCHTVRGGKDFAGGLPVPTPFGTIYSSNITPDAETGIGRWSEAAFRRAMQSGVDREGRHLYPTFPYDHFTNVSDDDDRALYAYPDDAASRSVRRPAKTSCRSRSISASWSRAGNCCSCATAPTSRTHEERGMESRRLPGRRTRPLRRLPHAAQRARRGTNPGRVCRRRRRQLARLRDQRANRRRRCRGMRTRCLISAPGWHPDHGVARGPMAEVVEQFVRGARERCSRDRDLHGRACSARRRRIASAAVTKCWRRPGRGRRSTGAAAAREHRRRIDLCRGLRDLPRRRTVAPPYGGINLGAQHRHQRSRRAQRRQHRTFRHPSRRPASAARSCPALPTA